MHVRGEFMLPSRENPLEYLKIGGEKMRIVGFVLLAVVMVVAPIHGQEKQKDLMDMSLEEILDTKVVTASKTAQSIGEAPAIIDVYTSKQISEMGIDNLYELLSMLAGIEIMETYYGYTDVQFRGILQTHYNNNSSLLLNGQPLYDQVVSCYYLEQIPVSSIQRIEVIRGPGGVLYGTNSFAGVINVITKKGKEIDGTIASFKAGTFNTKNVQFSTGKAIGELDLFFSGEFNESDGYVKTVEWDEDDVSFNSGEGNSGGSRQLGYYTDDKDAYENDYVNFFTSVGYKGFTLNAVYFENEKDKFGIIPTMVSTGERRLRGFGGNLRYSASLLNKKLDFTGVVWYDQIRKQERVNWYPPVFRAPGQPDDQDYGGNKTGGQVEFRFSVSEKINILGGGGFESSHADPYYFFLADTSGDVQDEPANVYTDPKDTRDIWGFLQASVRAAKSFNLLAGCRYNSNDQAGSAFVPSFGVVCTPAQNLSLKVLYGSGFRNPSFFEKYVRTVNILAGDINLVPETINTLDVGVDYTFSKYSVRLNGFYTTTDNMMGRRTLTAEDLSALNAEPGFGTGNKTWTKGAMYENGKGKSYKGVEFSIQGAPSASFTFRGNLSYKTGKDEDGNELMYFSPLLANIHSTVRLSDAVRFFVTFQYVGKRKGNYAAMYPWNSWPSASAGGTDYTIDAYTLLNVGCSVKLHEGFTLSVLGKNILNTEYTYPEYIRHAIPYIPGGPGRAVYGVVSYTL